MTYKNYSILSSTLIFLNFLISSSLAKVQLPNTLNVLTFGAKPDGSTDSTKAFLATWTAACASTNPTNIIIPQGRFLVKNLIFQGSSCKYPHVGIYIAGTIVAPADFRVTGNSEKWISFDDVTNVSIYDGILDGQGTSLWNCKNKGGKCPNGAKSLVFTGSKNIEIIGLTSVNSQKFHVVIDRSSNVKIDGVRVFADGNSPNTDGIHVESSNAVNITNSKIGTGDDCISIGPGTTNLFIQNIICGPGHGISIGSLGREEEEEGVENVIVSNVIFTGTNNGVRIKTWAKPSNGFVKNIIFQHIQMIMVNNPIIINQHYCINKPCPIQESGVKITDVRYENIYGTSRNEMAITLDCSKKNPCTGIIMDDVNLGLVNRPAEASCDNADGSANDVVPFATCLKDDLN